MSDSPGPLPAQARQLFGRDRPLTIVSVGTGAGVATETAPNSFFPAWLQNLVNATGDVAQVTWHSLSLSRARAAPPSGWTRGVRRAKGGQGNTARAGEGNTAVR